MQSHDQPSDNQAYTLMHRGVLLARTCSSFRGASEELPRQVLAINFTGKDVDSGKKAVLPVKVNGCRLVAIKIRFDTTISK